MKRFVFLGDSITDCYHSFDPDNLGEGYVRMIHGKLNSDYETINCGFDGFTMPALRRLWKRDGGALKPDFLTILIGINDIGVIQNTGRDPEFALAEFRMQYQLLIEEIRSSYSCPILLMEPFIFPYPEKYKLWNKDLMVMNQMISDIAQKYQLEFLPLWENLLRAAHLSGYETITTDGIHLTETSHEILANEWFSSYKKIR